MPSQSKSHRAPRATSQPIDQEVIRELVQAICVDDDGAHAGELVAVLAAASSDSGAALIAITTALTYTRGFQDCVTNILLEPSQLLRAVK